MPLQLPAVPNFNIAPPQMANPLDQYGKMLQLRSLQGQQQMQPYLLQQEQEKATQMQQQTEMQRIEMQSQQAMMKAWSDPKFLDSVTSGDAANASGLGFDPNGMTKALVAQGVTPKDALAMTAQFVERSQKMATIAKDQAQTTNDKAAAQDKGYKVLADQISSILDAPTAKAGDMLTQLKQDVIKNPQKYAGVPQQDLAHVYSADLEHLQPIANVMGLYSKISDAHKANAEAVKAQQGVIPAGGGLSQDSQQSVDKDVAVARATQPLKIAQVSAEANARQAAQQGDPNDAGKLLADGSLTLTDLKTRGSTPRFIEQATMAAQKINPKYNPADEIIAEQVAKSPAANQFFGSANSLIGKGGTLDQLVELGKKIPEHDFPVLNTIDDWQKLARGKGPLAGYAATALGVADDYGKVMGGGQASDRARDHALQLFSQAASPEQRADAVQATRNAVLSQRDSRIGNNQFLKRQYGTEVGGKVATSQHIADYAKAKGITADQATKEFKDAGYAIQ